MKLVLHYITFHAENQRPNQVSDPWYISPVLTGKPVCCSNCPSEGAQLLS